MSLNFLLQIRSGRSGFDRDPLALRTATARFLFESARLGFYNRRAVRSIDIPTLLILAEHDRIIDNTITRRVVSRFRTSEVAIHENAGAHHTLEFEPSGPPFVNDLLNWLRRHAATNPG